MKLTIPSLVLSAFLLSTGPSNAFVLPRTSTSTVASHINRSTTAGSSSRAPQPRPYVRSMHVLASQTQREQTKSKAGEPDPKDVDLKKYKIRSTILQHALQTKQKEASTLRDKLTILQDVIQKLQSSNKSLLSKVQELKNERNNIFLQVEEANKWKQELWPPEMDVKLMKEEFKTKELEWENSLNVAQKKYSDLKDRVNRLMFDVEERDADIRFYQERSEVDESEIKYLQGLVTKFQGRLEDVTKGDTSSSDKSVEDGQLEEMRRLIADLEEQNVIARDQFQELNAQWKTRREEMQRIISTTQNKVLSLETDLEQTKLEKDQIQIVLDQTKLELEESKAVIESMREGDSSPPTDEDQERVRQFGKESLDIATAAVRQAEAREMELKKKVARIEKKMEDTKGENDLLVQKVLDLELQLDTYEKASAAEDVLEREEELLKRIDSLEQELENAMASFEAMASGKGVSSESLKINEENNAEWEAKIAAQKQEYEELIEELKAEIDRLVKAKTAASLSIPPEETKPRERRLRRLVNRVKSLWRREKNEESEDEAKPADTRSEDETCLEPVKVAVPRTSASRADEQ